MDMFRRVVTRATLTRRMVGLNHSAASRQQPDHTTTPTSQPSLRTSSTGGRHHRSFSTSAAQRSNSVPTVQGLRPHPTEPHVYRSPYDDVDIPDVFLAQYMLERFSQHGDRTALIDGITGRTVTFSELCHKVPRLSSGLRHKLSLNEYDVITLLLPNCIEFCEIYLAAAAIGVTVSAVNPLYTAEEVRHAFELSSSKAIITIPQLLPAVQAAVAASSLDVKVLQLGPEYSSLMDFPPCEINHSSGSPQDEVLAVPFSSGTTGLPKGVMLTHHNVISNIEQIRTQQFMGYTYDDTLMAVLPFFHIFGQVVVLLAGLYNGSSCVILPRFDPHTFLTAFQKHKATYCHVAPPLALFLAKHPLVDQYDLSTLHTIVNGAATASPSIIEQLVHRLNNPQLAFRIGYGLTETSPVLLCNYRELHRIKFNSIGVPVHNVEFKIVDIDTGESLPVGKDGEIVARGPNVMKGYLKNPESTAQAIQNGWFHTGDIGYYDKDGYTYITDRLKELIKVKGFQVAPTELESLLLSHPHIADVAVIGKPDELLGEAPRAYVVLESGKSLTEEDVHGFVKGKVASFKELSGGVEFRSEIPKSLSGKILRRILKDELLAKAAE